MSDFLLKFEGPIKSVFDKIKTNRNLFSEHKILREMINEMGRLSLKLKASPVKEVVK